MEVDKGLLPLLVRYSNGITHRISVPLNLQISKLQGIICIPTQHQRLFFRGSLLQKQTNITLEPSSNVIYALDGRKMVNLQDQSVQLTIRFHRLKRPNLCLMVDVDSTARDMLLVIGDRIQVQAHQIFLVWMGKPIALDSKITDINLVRNAVIWCLHVDLDCVDKAVNRDIASYSNFIQGMTSPTSNKNISIRNQNQINQNGNYNDLNNRAKVFVGNSFGRIHDESSRNNNNLNGQRMQFPQNNNIQMNKMNPFSYFGPPWYGKYPMGYYYPYPEMYGNNEVNYNRPISVIPVKQTLSVIGSADQDQLQDKNIPSISKKSDLTRSSQLASKKKKKSPQNSPVVISAMDCLNLDDLNQNIGNQISKGYNIDKSSSILKDPIQLPNNTHNTATFINSNKQVNSDRLHTNNFLDVHRHQSSNFLDGSQFKINIEVHQVSSDRSDRDPNFIEHSCILERSGIQTHLDGLINTQVRKYVNKLYFNAVQEGLRDAYKHLSMKDYEELKSKQIIAQFFKDEEDDDEEEHLNLEKQIQQMQSDDGQQLRQSYPGMLLLPGNQSGNNTNNKHNPKLLNKQNNVKQTNQLAAQHNNVKSLNQLTSSPNNDLLGSTNAKKKASKYQQPISAKQVSNKNSFIPDFKGKGVETKILDQKNDENTKKNKLDEVGQDDTDSLNNSGSGISNEEGHKNLSKTADWTIVSKYKRNSANRGYSARLNQALGKVQTPKIGSNSLAQESGQNQNQMHSPRSAKSASLKNQKTKDMQNHDEFYKLKIDTINEKKLVQLQATSPKANRKSKQSNIPKVNNSNQGLKNAQFISKKRSSTLINLNDDSKKPQNLSDPSQNIKNLQLPMSVDSPRISEKSGTKIQDLIKSPRQKYSIYKGKGGNLMPNSSASNEAMQNSPNKNNLISNGIDIEEINDEMEDISAGDSAENQLITLRPGDMLFQVGPISTPQELLTKMFGIH